MQSIENMADPTDNKGIFLEGRLLPNHKISTWREYRPPTARPLMEISARQEPCPLIFCRMNSALWEKLIINRRLKPAAWAILEHSRLEVESDEVTKLDCGLGFNANCLRFRHKRNSDKPLR